MRDALGQAIDGDVLVAAERALVLDADAERLFVQAKGFYQPPYCVWVQAYETVLVNGQLGAGGRLVAVLPGPIKTANLALRFLLELGGLVALGYWGFSTGTGDMRFLLGLAAPLLMALAWALFVAPRSVFKLSEAVKAVLGLVILEVCAVALALAGQTLLAVIYGVIVAANAAYLSWAD